MINYKQIVEAVNRGIKFALDDYEDNDIQGQTNSKVSHHGGTKEYLEYLDLMNEVVDLELPSGTLWCKYNLDVDPNQLSKPENWYGKYYAWGELEPNKTNKDGKIYFSWNNYKFGNCYELTKYCNNSLNGLNRFTVNLAKLQLFDNLTQLRPEDDVVYQNKKLYNYKFHIPTKEQCEELKNYTTNYWVYNYDPNKIKHNPENDGGIKELNGRVFEGKNGNQLFIPAAGYHFGSSNYNDVGSWGSVWSSNLNLSRTDYAYFLGLDYAGAEICSYSRCIGYSIRPVINL